MKTVALIVWLVFVVVGGGIIFFAPQALESVLCTPLESIEKPSFTSLACVDESGQARDVSVGVIAPYLLVVIFAPIIFLVINMDYAKADIPNPAEVTFRKRMKALWLALLTTLGFFAFFFNDNNVAGEHRHMPSVKEIRAYFAYFLGNPQPLIAFNGEGE